MLKALIIYSNLPENAPPDELDVLEQADLFEKNLKELNFVTVRHMFSYNLDENVTVIRNEKPDIVVNLIETVFGVGRLIHIGPSILDYCGVPYTGSSTETIFITSNKLLAKETMIANGIPTAKYISLDNIHQVQIEKNDKFLIKAVWEHASVGIDEHNLELPDNKKRIQEILQEHLNKNQLFYAEKYIDGREFNISVAGTEHGPVVMPFAEMQFIDYPDGMAKVMGYRAKWDENAFEYSHTQRTFEACEKDYELHEKLKNICLKCWDVFKLKGYARVDFRVDADGNPYVLEINANPCISPHSGYVVACQQKGYTEKEIVRNIVNDSVKLC
jgi:D-alanine-D-alanine ligase